MCSYIHVFGDGGQPFSYFDDENSFMVSLNHTYKKVFQIFFFFMFFEYDSNIFGRARVCHRNLRNKILTTDRPSDIYPGNISPELFELLSRSIVRCYF